MAGDENAIIIAGSSANGSMSKTADDVVRSGRQIAATGVKVYGGRMYRDDDYNPALRGQLAAVAYEEMRRSDPEIASGVSRLTWPLVAAKSGFEPFDDSDEAKADAEFCDKWIFGTGRTDPFVMRKTDFMRHVLLMVADGCSLLEKVWGVDEEGHQVYAKLNSVALKTVKEFQFDTNGSGRFTGIWQQGYTADRGFVSQFIPAEQWAVFTFCREGDNMWGWPITRAAYMPWFLKKKLLRVDAQRHERFGLGVPVIKIPKGTPEDSQQRRDAESVAGNIRSHEYQFVVLENDYEFDIKQPTGAGTDIIGSVKYLDSQIAQVLIAEWMHLGASESGSRAVSGDKIQFMFSVLQGVANLIEDVINGQLVEPLMWRRYGPAKLRPRPVFKFQDLNKLAGPALAEVTAKLVQAKVLTGSPDIEERMREELQLPEMPKWLKDALQEAVKRQVDMMGQPPVMAAPAAGEEKAPANGGPPAPKNDDAPKDKPKEEPAEAAREFGDVMDSPLWRTPHMNAEDGRVHPEMYCEFEKMAAYLDTEPKRILRSKIEPIRKAAAAKIAARVSTMSDADVRKGVHYQPLFDKMVSATVSALRPVYMRGRAEVAAERARQKKGVGVALEDDDDLEITAPTSKQMDWVKTIAAGFVLSVYKGMQTRAEQVAVSVTRQAEQTKDAERIAIETALAELSLNQIERELKGAAARAFVTGREEQAAAYGDAVTAFYSAMMDKGTEQCLDNGGTCWILDGDEHAPGDAGYTVPNPNCAWPPNCRCVNVYLYEEAA